MSRSTINNNGIQMIKHLIEEADAYNCSTLASNSSILMNKSPKEDVDDVTQQILFCQNGIDNLNVCNSSTFVSRKNIMN